jgi:NAD(P)H-flavin reductase
VWGLAIVTASVAAPWLRLRKVPVEMACPSTHVALTRFDYGVTPFAGSSTAISRNPLWEWHSFANVPEPGRDGFRLTISRAGDWTGAFIDDSPRKVWVKGIPTAGVANIEVLFTKVVYVATGSGIGPCLPHLLAQEVPAQLIWATRNPRRTYGDELIDEIEAVQPDAVIWDTDANGKPDLVELAWDAVLSTGAEAVICISNKKLTWNVVESIERRGVPAYGAIWDS